MAAYSWYYVGYPKGLPAWEITVNTDEWKKIIHSKRLFWDNETSDIIRNIVPGNFFRLNRTTWEQRKVLTKILDIDTDKLQSILDDITKVRWELKVFNINRDAITNDIIRLEKEIDDIWELVEPEKWNEADILASYDKLYNSILDKNNKLSDKYNKECENIDRSKLNKLEKELENINNSILSKSIEWKKLKTSTVCTTCWVWFNEDTKSKLLDTLRKEYNDLLINKKKTIKLIEDEWASIDLQLRSIAKPTYDTPVYDISIENKAKVLWVDIKSNDAYIVYKEQSSKLDVYTAELKNKTSELKWFNSVQLEKELKKLEADRIDFNKQIETNIKKTWLDIRVFKVLKNWNIKETFEIYDNDWNQYWLTSTWNDIYIEILVAKLFIDYLKLDFILIDRYESIWNNLRTKIDKELKWLQVIATQVAPGKSLVLVSK